MNLLLKKHGKQKIHMKLSKKYLSLYKCRKMKKENLIAPLGNVTGLVDYLTEKHLMNLLKEKV